MNHWATSIGWGGLVNISEQDLKDLLIAGVEGGINYWAHVRNYDPDAGSVHVMEIEASEETGIVQRTITFADLREPLRRLAAELDESVEEVVENHDAATGDALIQMAIFGEVIYA